MAPVTEPHALRRAGQALLVAGAVDIALLAAFALAGVFYPSGLNVLALAAGHYLRNGSLRAAAVVRWTAWFMLAFLPLLAAGLLLVLPPAFWGAIAKTWPLASGVAVLALVWPWALAAWLVRELADVPMPQGPPARRRAWIAPLVSAAGVTAASLLLFLATQSIAVAQTAIAIARRQAGPEYAYVLVSLRVRMAEGALVFHGGVIAWKRDEAKYVPFAWRP